MKKQDGEGYDDRPIRGGYKRVPNSVFDFYMPLLGRRNPAVLATFLLIWRQTIGWDRTEISLTTRQIAAGVGWPRITATRAAGWLVEYGFLERRELPITIGRNKMRATTYIYRIADALRRSFFGRQGRHPDEPPDAPEAYVPPKFAEMLAEEAIRRDRGSQ